MYNCKLSNSVYGKSFFKKNQTNINSVSILERETLKVFKMFKKHFTNVRNLILVV